MKEVYFKIGDKSCKAVSPIRVNGDNITLEYPITCKLQLLNFAITNGFDFYSTESTCAINIPIEYIITVKNTDCDVESLT